MESTIKALRDQKSKFQAEVAALQARITEVDEKIAYDMCGIKIGTVISRIMYWIDERTGERILDKSPHHKYEKITKVSVDGDVVKVESESFYNSATKCDDCYRRVMFEWNPSEWRIVEEGLVESMIQRDELIDAVKDKKITEEIWCFIDQDAAIERPWLFDRFKEEFALTMSLLRNYQGGPLSIRLRF